MLKAFIIRAIKWSALVNKKTSNLTTLDWYLAETLIDVILENAELNSDYERYVIYLDNLGYNK